MRMLLPLMDPSRHAVRQSDPDAQLVCCCVNGMKASEAQWPHFMLIIAWFCAWWPSQVARRLQVERLRAVLAGDLEAYFEPRHVIDVLQEFPAARPPLPQVRANGCCVEMMLSDAYLVPPSPWTKQRRYRLATRQSFVDKHAACHLPALGDDCRPSFVRSFTE